MLGRTLALAVIVAALGLSCGGDDDDASPDAPAKVTIQLLPISDSAPIYLGVEKGFFEDEGIDLEIQTAQGGAEMVPLVVGGRVQVGNSNVVSLFSAATEGLPVEIVAPSGKTPAPKEGDGENLVEAVMVRKESDIRTAEDLKGATIAVNSLKSLSEIVVLTALEKHGIGPDDVKLLEVPIPEMLGALDAERVDAIYTLSPFKTQAELSGDYRSVMFPMLESKPGGQVNAGYFVERRWASENEDVLERFLRALRRSAEYSAEHEDETRATLPTFTELPPELVEKVPLGDRLPDCEELRATSEFLVERMLHYGIADERPDLDELIRPGFCDG